MSEVGVAEVFEAPLKGLLLAPRLNAGMCMTAQVVGAGCSLLRAQLPVCSPRLVVDADYAARGSLRRHVHSVTDRAVDGHLCRRATNFNGRDWPSVDLLVTGHPAVGFKGATAAPARSNRPP